MVLATTLVALLVASLLPTAAFAAHNPSGDDPCEDAPPATDFADYEEARDTHQPSIDCAIYRGITSGAGVNADGAPLYRPGRAVTRAQMAQFIVNTIVSAGYDNDLPDGQGQDEFSDISDNFARVAINRLARADIVGGTGGDKFTPNGFVTRQQMASFIVQAARHVVGENHPVNRDGDDQFRDVRRSNVHKANIEAGADAGLFRGTSATTFNPGARVLRDQMATFLVNQLDYTFNPDTAPAAYVAEVNIADTEVEAGGEVTGDITGEHITSATVSGCGLNDDELTDEDNQADGIQFSATIPSNQAGGECTLTFSVEFDNNSTRLFTQEVTVSAPNGVTVTLAKDTANPGEAVNGEITGTNVKSATVTGCGLTNETVQDRETTKAGIQFSEVIPASQQLGACTLTFKVTFNDNTTQDVTKQLRVVEKVGVTTRPELIAASIVSTTPTTGTTPGTVIRFLFDEAVTGRAPDEADFYVYSFDGSRTPGSSARTETSNTKSVLVRFNGIATESDARDLTVAGVAVGAVRDFQNQDNPEGSAPLGAQREETVRQAGITAAPDLQAIGGFRPVNASTTAVDFTFDEAAFVVNRGGFNVVLNDGRVASCQGPASDNTETGSGTSEAGGNGTTTITAICTNPSSAGTTTPITGSNVRRGYVNSGTVSDQQQVAPAAGPDEAEGNVNPLQAAASAAGATTDTPDLVSAEYRPHATGGDDTVVYTFDEPVVLTTANPVTGVPANLFQVYDTTGAEDQAESAERTTDTTITATFEPGTLADAVGASVRPGAVNGVTGAGTNQPNRADEVGVVNSATRTITPGKTSSPDLVSVEVKADGTAIYTFDEDVSSSAAGESSAVPSNFKLWAPKGEMYECRGVPGTGTFSVSGNKVTCGLYQAGNSQATDAQIQGAVLGSVAYAAVDDNESGVGKNPEGGVPTTGTTGTPEN